MKFELEAKVLNGKVVTNAKQLLESIETGLKSYNYVVTENTYDQAKKDRASLNKVVKSVSDERKRIEEDLFSEWKIDKKNIMDIEKKIKSVSDELGAGINAIDDEEKLQKKKQIEELWSTISNDKFKYELVHDDKYLNKSTNAKFIEDDLRKKFKVACEHEGFMDTFLPQDEFEAEQVKQVFYDTLDLTRAKVKADELNKLREQVLQAVSSQKQERKIEDIEVKPVLSHVENTQTSENENGVQFITFKVNALETTLKEFNRVLAQFMQTHQDMKIEVLEKGE